MTEWRVLSDVALVELVERLRSLKWSWLIEDFPSLADEFGWRVEMSDTSWVMFESGFGMGSGKVLGRDGRANTIRVRITDFVDEGNRGRGQTRDAFARFTTVLSATLGDPSTRRPGEIPEVRWAGPDTTLLLRDLEVSVVLELVTNSSLALQDLAAELPDEGLDDENI
ncbi:DUF6301 family protein [Nocardia sp. CA-290969]|uniref:DUF6301 family protein n=1 Tax=Nocardia sp. CA-290969 TaxID=3239986 RepID=UPI003D941BD6